MSFDRWSAKMWNLIETCEIKLARCVAHNIMVSKRKQPPVKCANGYCF